MRKCAFSILVTVGLLLVQLPAHSEQPNSVAVSEQEVVIDLEIGPDNTYLWSGRSYTLPDLLPALRIEQSARPFQQIKLGSNAGTSVQNIIDVATLAKEFAVEAFYYDGDELKHIEVTE